MENDQMDNIMKEAGFGVIDPQAPLEVKQEETIPTDSPVIDGAEGGEQDKEKSVQANDEKTEVKDQPAFDLESINKAFNKDFKSVDELTELFTLPDKYNTAKAELETKVKELSDKEKVLREQNDPMSYFADEQEFKINQILKNDKGLNRNIVSRLVYSDLSELKDEDVLKLNDLLKIKGTFDEKVVEMDIKDRYGLDINKEEADDDLLKSIPLKEYRMKKDADEARDALSSLLDVELPELKDPLKVAEEKNLADETAFNENKQKWDVFTKEFVKNFNKFPVKYNADDKTEVLLEFDVDDEFKQAVLDHLPEMAAKNNKDLSNEADVKGLVEQIQKDLWWLRRDRYLKVAIEDRLSKATKEEMEKYYNPSKPQSEEAPVSLSKEEQFNLTQTEKMKKDFNIKN